jgi:UDP-N-acetyl-D-galactosamine dehydrogenase
MGKHVATEVIKHMMRKNLKVIESKVLILGFTFKEDCPDVRNTRVIDIYNELLSFDMEVDVYDPWVNSEEVKHEFGIDVLNQQPDISQYSAVILAVAHKKFNDLDLKTSGDRVIYDVKGVLNKTVVDARL